MLLAVDKLEKKGKYGMINMHSWMFLSSFEGLRRTILNNYHIDSLLHLGSRTFDELKGEVVQNSAFVLTKDKIPSVEGKYFRLVEGNDCFDKKNMFLESLTNHIENVYYPHIGQQIFNRIPGFTIGYWLSNKMIHVFDNQTLSEIATPRQGMATSDNNRFLRLWFEPQVENISFNSKNNKESLLSKCKWFPYNKGGSPRKWYGNQEFVVNWQNDGEEIKHYNGSVVRNPQTYFQPSVSWSKVSTASIAFRYFPNGFIYDVAGTSLFFNDENYLNYSLGLVNSKVIDTILKLFPTINYEVGQIASLPFSFSNNDLIDRLVKENIDICKMDWDAHETSWNFKTNPLIYYSCINKTSYQDNHNKSNVSILLNTLIKMYIEKWGQLFIRLHNNEEKLNQIFIEIYGLQEELSYDVQLDKISILQQGEISIKDNIIIWHQDVLLKQLISYAVGVWMGRYKLGKEGLHIAHPNPTAEELKEYRYENEIVYIDDDGLIPILPQNTPIKDNLSTRISDFIRVVFGAENLTENLNYIEQQLGQTIDQYVQKDYWKDHKKMYQNRPIYWLFSSKKGAFKCLAYMHRMDAYTAERVRTDYLLPYIEYLENHINEMQSRASQLSTKDNRTLQNLQKALEECQEYHDNLQVVAEKAIGFDLDDGVVVNYAKFGDVLAKIK